MATHFSTEDARAERDVLEIRRKLDEFFREFLERVAAELGLPVG